jgi:hypothetical protein
MEARHQVSAPKTKDERDWFIQQHASSWRRPSRPRPLRTRVDLGRIKALCDEAEFLAAWKVAPARYTAQRAGVFMAKASVEISTAAELMHEQTMRTWSKVIDA